jgi:hypothetical protein
MKEQMRLASRSTDKGPTRLGRVALALVLALGAPAALAPGALATHTVTAFSVTPASTQAGASVNASSSTSLSYTNLTEDVKKTIGHFAPGLLANPEAVPHCPQALYLADACPPETRIGEAEADIQVFPAPPITERGRIYNQELLGSEAGRLGIIIDTAPSKSFLTAPFFVRTNGDFGLDGVLDDIARVAPGVQVTRLSFTLYGTVGGRNFTRGPTSCSLKVSTGEAFGYEHTDSVSGPSSSYTPTGCDTLPFKPTFAISVGSKGTTGFNRNPPLRVTVTQQPGEAGVLSNGVTLPAELTPNVAAFGTICTAAQLAADACPAGSRVGGARATSSFLATPLVGPVWLVQQPGAVLPSLVADLKGRVPIKVNIGTSIVGGRQISSTVANVPDLPIGSFSLGLDGGREGVLLAKSDLCFASEAPTTFRTMNAAVTFGGHNGANVSSSPRIEVEGCAPAVDVSLRRAGRAKPKLRLEVDRHPDAEKIGRAELVLPRELRLVRGKVERGVTANASVELGRSSFNVKDRRTLEIALPRGGTDKLALTLHRGAIKPSGKLRRKLRAGRRPRLKFRLVAFDAAGQRLVTRASVRTRK